MLATSGGKLYAMRYQFRDNTHWVLILDTDRTLLETRKTILPGSIRNPPPSSLLQQLRHPAAALVLLPAAGHQLVWKQSSQQNEECFSDSMLELLFIGPMHACYVVYFVSD